MIKAISGAMTSVRLLNVCETARGGVGVYQNILMSLNDVGFEVQVVAPQQHAAIFTKGLNVVTFNNPRRGPKTIWRLVRKFVQTRKHFQPDICFFHSTFSLAALAWARICKPSAPMVYCAHGWGARNFDAGSLKGWVVRKVEGTLCGLADVVVNVSIAERDLAIQHGYRGRHVVVDNAVAPANLNARGDLFADQPDKTHLLFVGRFDRQKGLDLLLPAFAAARAIRPDLTLHIVGAAVREDHGLDALPDGVSLAGWVDAENIDDWYRSADALVVSSRWEGLPLVIPEAYRNGTPVLCSNASGMDQLVEIGQTGDAFDLTEQGITTALTRYTKADLRSMRAAAKQRYLDHYQVGRLRDEIATVLRGILP